MSALPHASIVYMTFHFGIYRAVYRLDIFDTNTDTLIMIPILKGMEHVPNIFISFDKYLFLELINILI